MVVFREGEAAEVLENTNIRKTTLTEYFNANSAANNRVARGQPFEFDCRELLYQEFPTRMTWNARRRQWKDRNARFSTISRMAYVSPAAGERFYIWSLL